MEDFLEVTDTASDGAKLRNNILSPGIRAKRQQKLNNQLDAITPQSPGKATRIVHN